MNPETCTVLKGRRIEFFSHPSDPDWGYERPQTDSFAVIHPRNEIQGRKYPLYVVLHSAGHDLYTTVHCLYNEGDHDIYHTPDDTCALIPDCYANGDNDWWWGCKPDDPYLGFDEELRMKPVEKRVMSTVFWTMDNYCIDRERVYAVGNSMGGSGALGIAYCRGDVFAAVKVNVPAGVSHLSRRCALECDRPEGFRIPDPPVTVDYSAQNDSWSYGHDILFKGTQKYRYPLMEFFGPFGHQNNNSELIKFNDLIHSFDIGSVSLHEPYPVFTNASTDDPIPWPDKLESEASGQVNGFFRWRNVRDDKDVHEIELRLLRQDEWESRVTFPQESTADVTLRRRQNFILSPGENFSWEFRGDKGVSKADDFGVPTIFSLKITDVPAVLTLKK